MTYGSVSDETRVTVLLAGAYSVAYLAVYSMAIVVLRMVYPIAVFPVIFAIGALAATWKAVAVDRSRAGTGTGTPNDAIFSGNAAS